MAGAQEEAAIRHARAMIEIEIELRRRCFMIGFSDAGVCHGAHNFAPRVNTG
jgi:hypothetical protein